MRGVNLSASELKETPAFSADVTLVCLRHLLHSGIREAGGLAGDGRDGGCTQCGISVT